MTEHNITSGRRCKGVAIVCSNASFRWGGEAAIPLRFFQYFRDIGLTVYLLTHVRVQAELEEALSAEELAYVIFFPDTKSQKWIYKKTMSWPSALKESFVYHVNHLVTEAQQKKKLREMTSDGLIDVVYMPTPISPKVISLINDVGAPTVFGPLNGAMNYPLTFQPKSGRVVEALIAFGRWAAEPLHFLFPAKRNAAAILVSNPRTIEGLPRAVRRAAIMRSYDATIEAARWRNVIHAPHNPPTEFLSVGRLVDWKAFEYAILAAHRVEGALLTIVGDGPERPRLEKIAAEGPATITFKGFMNHDELLALYPYVIAQILPSLREAGGNVCLEALAAGVPVIATKWGGMTDVVADGVDGFLISPNSEEALIAGIAAAMKALKNDTMRARYGRGWACPRHRGIRLAREGDGPQTCFEQCLAGNVPAMSDAHPSHSAEAQGLHRNLAWRQCKPTLQRQST
jgi:glycosyltransferase involved in cell wall biosynthesis